MPKNPKNMTTDLRAVGSLAVDAVIGITDIVESLHHQILNFYKQSETSEPQNIETGQHVQARTKGITGMVYRNIRNMTQLVGKGIDAPLKQMGFLLTEKQSFPAREALISALNGVLGDHLVARENPLAIPMQFRREGKPLDQVALKQLVKQSKGRLLIMVHGSCMNDLEWNRKGHDHGASLALELGIEAIYLHYNSGLHISENGRAFAHQLQTLSELTAEPIALFIVAHSMGGLVARSACHYANICGHKWQRHLQKMVFLGTPHQGAPLEKGGNWLDTLLLISPYSAPFARLGKIRSCGVTDLRYGNMVDEDWKGRDRFKLAGDNRVPVPLPNNVRCYSVAATTSKAIHHQDMGLVDNLIGDGLVSVNSALGYHNNSQLQLDFPKENTWIGSNMNHMALLNHPQVYKKIKNWLIR